MKVTSSILTLTAGAIFGIAFALSCGNGSPHVVDASDAAACTCPAAEPPLSGRIVEMDARYVIPANSVHQTHGSAACTFGPSSGIPLNGGCTADLPLNGSIVLEQSAPEGVGWVCSWSNPSNVDVSVHALVRCLMPAQ